MWRTCSIISASIDRRPCGVDDQHVAAEAPRLFEPATGGRHRVAGLAEHGHVDLAAEGTQLLDGGGSLQVGADHQRLAALTLEPTGQLGRVGRLTRTLQAGHQDDRRRTTGVGDLQRLAAEQGGQLVVDDLDDLLPRVERLAELGADRLLADRATTLRTTPTLTSASNSAVRISLRTSSTSASVSLPLPRIFLMTPSRREDSVSNIAPQAIRATLATV
jgi:hypothetical protein